MTRKSKSKKQLEIFTPDELPPHAVVEITRPAAPVDYKPPTNFPDFYDAARVTLDYETLDPELLTRGSGVLRGDAYIVGTGLFAKDKDGKTIVRGYYPQRHNYGENCNAERVDNWLRDNFARFRGELCGANVGLYDGMFSRKVGIEFPYAKWRDVQWAEALLDENSVSYRLNDISKKYKLPPKATEKLTEKYGKGWIKNFPEIHPGDAEEYVLMDLDLPDQILDIQTPLLAEQGLTELYDLESRLTPMLQYMRETGVRVNTRAAENFNDDLIILRDAELEDLSKQCGFPVDYDNYGKQTILPKIFSALGIPDADIPKTEKGHLSFKKDWLDSLSIPAAKNLVAARSFEKARGTFVQGYILDYAMNDRIHCEFHPLRRRDEEAKNGAGTGRFACSHPNLQNIPVRDPFLGPILRRMFIPEPGAEWWSIDFSQIEYRFLIHFCSLAKMPGAEVARAAYLSDPNTDFHQLTAQLMETPLVAVLMRTVWKGVQPEDWKKLVRKIAKNINFGLAYGMGVDKLAVSLGLAEFDGKSQKWLATQPARDIIATYHEMNPYIKPINKLASAQAQERGYIKTFLGRRRRFDTWEPAKFEPGVHYPAYEYDEALRIYGDNIRRAGTHKALNAVLQGSSGDLIKAAMVKMWESGIFDKRVSNDIWLHLTEHDELDGSVLPTERGKAALAEIKNIMETIFTLRVPVIAELGVGPTWFEAH